MEVLIVGNGAAGCSAAAAVREISPGAGVTVVTAETEPLYSPCVLPHYLSGRLERGQVMIGGGQDPESLGVKVLTGEKVERVDLEGRRVFCSRPLDYDRLILAVGAEAVRPTLPGSNLPGNCTLKTLADADELRRASFRRAVVVGSGPIGVETALAVIESGREAVLIEKQDRVLPAMLGKTAGEMARTLLEAGGIEVLCETEVNEVTGHTRVQGVRAGARDISCDAVIWNVGMKPATTFLRGSGLCLSPDGYVGTDRFMETSIPGVYACGDCLASLDPVSRVYRPFMLWHRAKEEGRTAGYNAAGASIAAPVPVQRVVVNIGDSCFAALGPLPDDYDRVEEHYMGSRYYCLVYCRDRLVHMHSVNDPRGPGLFSFLLGKKGKPPAGRELFYRRPALR